MALIVGGVGCAIVQRTPDRLKGLATAGGIGLLVLLGVYPVFAFLPIWPPDSLPAASLYRPPWRAIRDGGSFGIPHQDGLKAVALLKDIGALPLPYDSNASAEVTTWYLPTAERCDRMPGSYVIVLSERPPSEALPPRNGWLILVRGQAGALVRVTDDTQREFSQLAVEAPSRWFDDNLARLERPLSVPRALCNRAMPDFWRPN
jgi:hypothetical protein